MEKPIQYPFRQYTGAKYFPRTAHDACIPNLGQTTEATGPSQGPSVVEPEPVKKLRLQAVAVWLGGTVVTILVKFSHISTIYTQIAGLGFCSFDFRANRSFIVQ